MEYQDNWENGKISIPGIKSGKDWLVKIDKIFFHLKLSKPQLNHTQPKMTKVGVDT